MAFDLSTAKPYEEEKGGFDLSTAKPINEQPIVPQEDDSFLGGIKKGAEFGAELGSLALGAKAGAVAGTALAPLTGGASIPIGAVLGAGLAYGGTKAGIRALKGEKATLPEAAITSAKDIKEGVEAEMLGQGLGKTVSGIASAVIPKVSKEMTNLFNKFNIKRLPSEGLEKPSKTLAILESTLGYTPLSGDVLADYSAKRMAQLNDLRSKVVERGGYNKGEEYIGNAIKNEAKTIIEKYHGKGTDQSQELVTKFMDNLGQTGTKYEAGKTLKESIASSIKVQKDKVKSLYNEADDVLGKDKVEKIPLSTETKEIAKSLLKEELAKPKPLRDKGLLSLLNSFKDKEINLQKLGIPYDKENFAKLPQQVQDKILAQVKVTPSGYKWEGLKGTRTELGFRISKIYKETGGLGNNEARVYKVLSEAIENDMEAFAKTKGDDVWGIYKTARESSKQLHEMFDKDVTGLINKKNIDIVKNVIESNDVDRIIKLKQSLGKEGLDPIKNTFTKQILDKSINKNGTVNSLKLDSELKKVSPEMLSQIYTKKEINGLKNIIDKSSYINEKYFGNKMKSLNFLDTIAGTSNEKITSFLFKPENISNIKLAKRVLSPERITELQEHALRKVFKTTPNGDYLPLASSKEFSKNYRALKELLGDNAIKDVSDFVKVSSHMSAIENLALNTSKTGQVFVGYEILKTALSYPLRLIKTLGAPWAIAKIYTNDKSRELIKKAISLPANNPDAIKYFAQSLLVAFPEEKNTSQTQ